MVYTELLVQEREEKQRKEQPLLKVKLFLITKNVFLCTRPRSNSFLSQLFSCMLSEFQHRLANTVYGEEGGTAVPFDVCILTEDG